MIILDGFYLISALRQTLLPYLPNCRNLFYIIKNLFLLPTQNLYCLLCWLLIICRKGGLFNKLWNSKYKCCTILHSKRRSSKNIRRAELKLSNFTFIYFRFNKSNRNTQLNEWWIWPLPQYEIREVDRAVVFLPILSCLSFWCWQPD